VFCPNPIGDEGNNSHSTKTSNIQRFVKGTLFLFFNLVKWRSIYMKFLPAVGEEILIQNISTKCGYWLNILC